MTRPRRRPPPANHGGMDPWVRNLVMVVTLVMWTVVVGAYLIQGKLPDAPLLGVPGAVYFALSPTLLRRQSSGEQPVVDAPASGCPP